MNALGLDSLPLLRLLQLASPTLPIGAFAYSQGLETAIALGYVTDPKSAHAWMVGLLDNSLRTLDVPIFCRLFAAWERTDLAAVHSWNERLFASRSTSELANEDRQLGSSLARLLLALGLPEAEPFVGQANATLISMFTLAAARWQVPEREATLAYLFSWAEAQVSAATRLVPLGQTDGQRILVDLSAPIARAAASGRKIEDGAIGASTPGHGVVCALHETQYARLFRS